MTKANFSKFNDFCAYRNIMTPIIKERKLLHGNIPERDHDPKDPDWKIYALCAAIILTIAYLLCLPGCAYGYTVDQWANAIKKQEGRNYPYGIKQYGHISEFKARIICKRTIQHKWHNYLKLPLKTRQTMPFIVYLADKYCPFKDDPTGNMAWKHNLPLLLMRGG